MVGKQNPNKNGKEAKTSYKKVQISDVIKRQLAGLVEQNSHLWNLADPDYMKRDKKSLAWDNITTKLGLTVTDCKSTWRALRDGMRYRKVNQIGGKSGDSGTDTDCDVEDQGPELTSWIFYDCMKFMMNVKPPRRTSSTLEIEEPTEIETKQQEPINIDSSDVTEESVSETPVNKSMARKSNYDYASESKRVKISEKGVDKLTSELTDFIALRKQSLTTQPSTELVYQSMFANLDRILKQLPSSIVEDLNMEFTTIAYAALKKQRELQSAVID